MIVPCMALAVVVIVVSHVLTFRRDDADSLGNGLFLGISGLMVMISSVILMAKVSEVAFIFVLGGLWTCLEGARILWNLKFDKD